MKTNDSLLWSTNCVERRNLHKTISWNCHCNKSHRTEHGFLFLSLPHPGVGQNTKSRFCLSLSPRLPWCPFDRALQHLMLGFADEKHLEAIVVMMSEHPPFGKFAVFLAIACKLQHIQRLTTLSPTAIPRRMHRISFDLRS